MLVVILAVILTSALVGFIAGALLAERVVHDVKRVQNALNEIDGCIHADLFDLEDRVRALEAAGKADVAKIEAAASADVKAVEAKL